MTRGDLSVKTLRSLLSYDPETGEFVWRASPTGSVPAGAAAGFLSGNGYRGIMIYGHNYRAHRLAWLYMTGEWPSMDIDHRDRNRLNNRWSNLREASKSQNTFNAGVRADNKVGLKGASFHKATGRWQANIKAYGARHYLGIFNTPEEAHAAYCEAAEKLHGKFARVS